MDNFRKLSLILIVFVSYENLPSTNSIGVHFTPQEFCYSDPACGPNSTFWRRDSECGKGTQQSPVNLQINPQKRIRHSADGVYSFLPLQSLKSDHFFLQNNGHTVNIDFIPSIIAPFCTSYPIRGSYIKEPSYKFGNAHFHWGKHDGEGSEHRLNGKSFSMEMHLVHYNSRYSSIQKAVSSGDPEALVVIGIFLQASPNYLPNHSLRPIISNLEGVKNKTAFWEKVDVPIDLSKLIPFGSRIYYYRGSLTTPGCNEVVDWYVFETPVQISSSDVKAFRQVSDDEGLPLMENHRPIQPVNSRKVQLLAH